MPSAVFLRLSVVNFVGSLYAFNAHQTAVNNANATATTQANNAATAKAAQVHGQERVDQTMSFHHGAGI